MYGEVILVCSHCVSQYNYCTYAPVHVHVYTWSAMIIIVCFVCIIMSWEYTAMNILYIHDIAHDCACRY